MVPWWKKIGSKLFFHTFESKNTTTPQKIPERCLHIEILLRFRGNWWSFWASFKSNIHLTPIIRFAWKMVPGFLGFGWPLKGQWLEKGPTWNMLDVVFVFFLGEGILLADEFFSGFLEALKPLQHIICIYIFETCSRFMWKNFWG